MSAEVLDVHLLVDEVPEEVCAVPDEGGGEQAQELHDSVGGALVVEHLQQAGHRAVLLHQLHHTVKLGPRGSARHGQTRAAALRPRDACHRTSTFKSSSQDRTKAK